jgi:hypothetical protein
MRAYGWVSDKGFIGPVHGAQVGFWVLARDGSRLRDYVGPYMQAALQKLDRSPRSEEIATESAALFARLQARGFTFEED